MPPIRTRFAAAAAAVVTAVLLTAGSPVLPVMAAGSPEAAVNELLDAVVAQDTAALEALVCEAERDAIMDQFDLSTSMDIDDPEMAAKIGIRFDGRAVQLVSEDGDEATVSISGTMSLEVAEEDRDEVLRRMAEAQVGEDASDEDLELVMPFLEMALSMSFPMDEEVTVVREDGDWVVCGGLAEPVDEPDFGFEPQVSTDGLCAFASPEELSTLSGLAYDSSSGFGAYCTWSSSDDSDYHSVSVSLELDQDVEQLAPWYSADEALEVGDAPALATGPDAALQNLLTQAGEDVLIVSVTLPEDPPEGLDWLTQARQVTELFLPRAADARLALAGPTTEPTPEPTPSISLCEAVPLEQLNEMTGLGFDEASGDPAYCGYSSLDGNPGWSSVSVSLSELPLDQMATFLPGLEETTVGELRAAAMEGFLLVELPGGTHTLQIGGLVDPASPDSAPSTEELLLMVAELVAPWVGTPEPSEAYVEDPATDLADPFSSEPPDLPRPMCEYLDLEAVNALGLVAFESQATFYEQHCYLSAPGPIEVSALADGISIESVRGIYGEDEDVTVAGRPGLLSPYDLRVESSAGAIGFTAYMTQDAGLTMAELLLPVAELVITAIEADLASQ